MSSFHIHFGSPTLRCQRSRPSTDIDTWGGECTVIDCTLDIRTKVRYYFLKSRHHRLADSAPQESHEFACKMHTFQVDLAGVESSTRHLASAACWRQSSFGILDSVRCGLIHLLWPLSEQECKTCKRLVSDTDCRSLLQLHSRENRQNGFGCWKRWWAVAYRFWRSPFGPRQH